MFQKRCPVCGEGYESEVRHQKYCSPVCREKAQMTKRRRRREYSRVQEIARIVSSAHRLASLVAEIFLDKKCARCGSESDLEVHHVDLNPLNNVLSNLQILCRTCHGEIHSTLPRINIVHLLNQVLSEKREGASDSVVRFCELFDQLVKNPSGTAKVRVGSL